MDYNPDEIALRIRQCAPSCLRACTHAFVEKGFCMPEFFCKRVINTSRPSWPCCPARFGASGKKAEDLIKRAPGPSSASCSFCRCRFLADWFPRALGGQRATCRVSSQTTKPSSRSHLASFGRAAAIHHVYRHGPEHCARTFFSL